MVKSNGIRPLHLLLPISSLLGSLNFLEYTANIVRTQNGHIHLYHVTDLMSIPEYHNPLSISTWVSDRYRQAVSRIDYFRSAIKELGTDIESWDSSVGNPGQLLQMKIETLSPDVIVIEQNHFSKRIIAGLSKQASCPVLIIPEKGSPTLINAASLLVDNDPQRRYSFELLQDPTIQKNFEGA